MRAPENTECETSLLRDRQFAVIELLVGLNHPLDDWIRLGLRVGVDLVEHLLEGVDELLFGVVRALQAVYEEVFGRVSGHKYSCEWTALISIRE